MSQKGHIDDLEVPQPSQTASDYIDEQLALEADAKEILPYKFDKCTYALGPLRQSVFACLTCSPPPASPAQVYTPAGICYACSISCHTEHNLVELFQRRNFQCDCGTTRFHSTSPCTLRSNSNGERGVSGQEAAKTNTYNQNFQNKFCGCAQEYDADTEKGTMYQCLGLGTVETGGCGEDWWHPECLMGLPKNWLQEKKAKPRKNKSTGEHDEAEPEHPVPEGFPEDDDFTSLICYKCVESNPWIKPYAGANGFLAPLFKIDSPGTNGHAPVQLSSSLKRKASDDDEPQARPSSPTKRLKEEDPSAAVLAKPTTSTLEAEDTTLPSESTVALATETGVPSTAILKSTKHKHDDLPPTPVGCFTIFCCDNYRDAFCHCPQCFPSLIPHPQLQDEEDSYEPSISDSAESLINGGNGTGSVGSRSLLDRGEAALNNMDRVRAIEGVMAYNHLKDKVKEFLKPYAETGKVVSAEDVKAYFEKLRGDSEAVREAGEKPLPSEGGDGGHGSNRKEQSGY